MTDEHAGTEGRSSSKKCESCPSRCAPSCFHLLLSTWHAGEGGEVRGRSKQWRRKLTPSDRGHSECTATVAEMAKMLADLESKMGPSHSASILLRSQLKEAKLERDGAKPLLEKILTAEKRLRTQRTAVEAATTKSRQL